jgi:S1-C subfamily serine protease
MSRGLTWTFLGAGAAVAAVAAGVVGGVAAVALFDEDGTEAVATTMTATVMESAVVDGSVVAVAESAARGVVEITATFSQQTPFGGSEEQEAQGSGFVLDRRGHVVTNQHVVAEAETISVALWNGATYEATLVGTDPSTDLAVVKVNAPARVLTPLALGDSGLLRVGDPVVAIGSPFGLEQSVTSGIVSALHRQMTAPNNFTITDSIQTDAAINHGNSGGPLLNLRGRVIGVNAQIRSESGGNDGVGFAIPSNTVAAIVPQLIATGTAEHAYLGVSLVAVTPPVPEGLDVVAGVAVTAVRDGSPAADAGLRAATGSQTVAGVEYPIGGDVIVAVDGRTVETPAELQSAIDAKRPDDTVTLTIVRGGEQQELEVTLATRPASAS